MLIVLCCLRILILPLTREDIRQWFCTVEIPYATFRSPTGEIYPWFHGKHYSI